MLNNKLKIPGYLPDDHMDRTTRYIYLFKMGINFKNPVEDLYKIGHTRDIKLRMQSLMIERSLSVELISYGLSGNYIKAERRLQDHFQKFRHFGEYFIFPEEMILKVHRELSGICIYHNGKEIIRESKFYEKENRPKIICCSGYTDYDGIFHPECSQ
jgi:hypothetical protein